MNLNPDDNGGLAQRRSGLSPQQRAVLAQRMRGGKSDAPTASGIPRRAGNGPAPLSYAQQRHWFLWQLDPDSTAYHISGALDLVGHLDHAALEASFSAVVARHEALRTVFRDEGDGAVQRVQPAAPVVIPVIDLSGEVLDRESRRARAQAEAQGVVDRPFDLTQGPLLRVSLIRLQAQEHLLVVAMHHIVTDAWSKRVLLEEFARTYAALASGAAMPQFKPLPIQYADYAAWQRDWFEGAEKEKQLA